MSNVDPSQEDFQIDIRKYREAEDRAAAAKKEAEGLQRQLALKDVEFAATMAGLPTGTGAGKAFVESYTGPTDPDSIKAAGIEWGLYKAEGAPAGGTQADEAQAQVDADRAALQNAGLAPDGAAPPEEHPGKIGLREYFTAKAEGQRGEDAAASLINRLVDAGVKGDPRVIVPDSVNRR